MHRRWTMMPLVVVALSVSLAACGQVGKITAKRDFREANTLYTQQDYVRAAEKYEEAILADPNLTEAYFYLANSYDNLYRPTRIGEPENDAYLTKAIDHYRTAAERADDPRIRKLALEYLVAAYGPDKMNDPDAAEPIVRQMIEMEPNEPGNYFILAGLYEGSGLYEEAEEALLKAREIRPDDPAVYLQLAQYYNRQGEFEKTMEALGERAAREPDNPEAHYTIAAYYQEKAFRDFSLTDEERRDYVMAGLDAVNRALDLRDDYVEALVYKNILLRMQANTETDRARIDALIREADELRDRAQELRKQQVEG